MARRRGAFPMCHNTQNRPGGARVAALSAPMRALTGALASLTKTIQALPSLAPSLQHPLTAFARLKSGSHTPKGNFSSKRGNKGFYKGKGDKKYGKATSKGLWVQTKLADWVMPDLSNFTLKPYVAYGVGPCGKRVRRRWEPIDPELLVEAGGGTSQP